MYLELIDALRCTEPHEDSPLVASIAQRADRDILSGTLGCPICHREYVIEKGVALFGKGPEAAPPTGAYDAPAPDLALRCAALLDLREPGGIVLLGGGWGIAAADLVEMTGVLVILVSPPGGVQVGNEVGALRFDGPLPVAPAALRGMALDEATSTMTVLDSAVRALKPRGRLIAPALVPVPAGLVERARDDLHWMAEVEGAGSSPVPLLRRRDARSH